MTQTLKVIFTLLFAIAFLVMYGIVPIVFVGDYFPAYVHTLFYIALLCTITFTLTLNFPSLSAKKIKYPHLALDYQHTLFFFFGVFCFFTLILILTARSVPLIEALKGASEQDLATAREDFLKGRTGIESSLNYINSILNTTFIPYLIVLGYIKQYKYRHVFALVFFFVTLLFLEKAYFLKIGIPLFVVLFYQAKNKKALLVKALVAVFSIFLLMYLATGFTAPDTVSDEQFFSIARLPTNPVEAMVWRIVVVPIITALDGIRLFTTDFNSQFFWGRTSSFFVFLFGGERINFERSLYQEQFGGTELGNANQFYGIEAYINFGYWGVIIFSFFIALIIKAAIKSKDIAFIAIMPLLIYNLFNTGLIGNLLSNGFIFFLLFIALVKIR